MGRGAKQVIFLYFICKQQYFPPPQSAFLNLTALHSKTKQVEIVGHSLRVQVTEGCHPEPFLIQGAAALL